MYAIENELNKIYKALFFCTNGLSLPPVILCIGSDRVTGDCFGPLVGEELIRRHNINTFVYGTLSTPVTALNIVDTAAFLKSRHPHRRVLAIDSALGIKREIGCLRVFDEGLYPGAAVGKTLPKVGDFSLTATVAEQNPSELAWVRLGLIVPLARAAAIEIARVFKAFRHHPAASC